MKKLLSLALVLAMLLTMSVTAFAADINESSISKSGSTTITYSADDSYVVTIPDSITVGTDATVSVSNVTLAQGYNLVVSVSSKNNWTLKNGDNTIGYTLKIDDSTIVNNGTVLTVKSGETASKTLKTTLSGAAMYSGSYNDTLTFNLYVFPEDSINAISMSAADLKAALTAALREGKTELDITLAADADKTMTTAIFEAITGSNATDGSLSLTLRGITTIAEEAFVKFGDQSRYPYIDTSVYMNSLGSLTLTDVTTIETKGFSKCSNLKSLTAPKLQNVGESAFIGHNLSVIDLPEATTLGFTAFDSSIATITKVNLPKVTEIHPWALGSTGLKYANGAEIILTGLTDNFEFYDKYGGSTYTDFIAKNQVDHIDLTLSTCMNAQVNGNTWTFKNKFDGGTGSYTFKSIKFVDTTN